MCLTASIILLFLSSGGRAAAFTMLAVCVSSSFLITACPAITVHSCKHQYHLLESKPTLEITTVDTLLYKLIETEAVWSIQSFGL